MERPANDFVAWAGQTEDVEEPNWLACRRVVVNGVRGPWLLDTGANQSVVSRTFAERLGMTPLPGVASVGSGLTGRQSSLRVAVLPTMHLGGATLTNVVLLILDDENLRFGSGPDTYQINAVLGYPILKALGVVTFTRDEFLAEEAPSPADRRVEHRLVGALLRAVPCAGGLVETQILESAGAGGSSKHDLYVQPRLVMKMGSSTATLQDVSITPIRMNAGLDRLFGNLGQDFVDSFESVSLNFSTMTFSLGAPRAIR